MTFREEFNNKSSDVNVSNNDKISIIGVLKSLKQYYVTLFESIQKIIVFALRSSKRTRNQSTDITHTSIIYIRRVAKLRLRRNLITVTMPRTD